MKAHLLTVGLLLIGEAAVAIVPPVAWDVEQAPANIPTDSRIAPSSEPGTPLLISGTVYAADGVTPLAGAVLYARTAPTSTACIEPIVELTPRPDFADGRAPTPRDTTRFKPSARRSASHRAVRPAESNFARRKPMHSPQGP